ncbi:MAG: glucose 1-dehydrogenase [Alphaproteobacteria bacterium]|nr:glucose 1-dehydrogenase [Alphaproteobacteria bacterium]
MSVVDINTQNLDELIEREGARITRDCFRAGDVVVVTGCARGFGRAISRRMAREGARLAIFDVIDDEGENVAGLCRDAGAETAFFHCDMADVDNIRAAARAVLDRYGTVYAVVNNAGINPRYAALDVPVEVWDRTLNVNLRGTVFCSQAFAPAMIKAGRGAIVNLASGRAIEATPNGIHYAASKAGIVSVTKTLSAEWGKHGIRVNAIIPAASETRQPLEAVGVTLEDLRRRGTATPAGRVGHPEDIAGMVRLLLSEDAAFITGQSIAINGGRIMLP